VRDRHVSPEACRPWNACHGSRPRPRVHRGDAGQTWGRTRALDRRPRDRRDGPAGRRGDHDGQRRTGDHRPVRVGRDPRHRPPDAAPRWTFGLRVPAPHLSRMGGLEQADLPAAPDRSRHRDRRLLGRSHRTRRTSGQLPVDLHLPHRRRHRDLRLHPPVPRTRRDRGRPHPRRLRPQVRPPSPRPPRPRVRLHPTGPKRRLRPTHSVDPRTGVVAADRPLRLVTAAQCPDGNA
jgi:hypothetical protein